MAGMKVTGLLVFFIFFMFINAGCFNEDESISSSQPVFKSENTHITYLFSNNERMEDESSYYDALLDFRRKYPDQINTISIVSSNDEELVNYFEVEIYPTLLVIYDLNVKVRIEGFKDSQEIYSLLESTLFKNEDAS